MTTLPVMNGSIRLRSANAEAGPHGRPIRNSLDVHPDPVRDRHLHRGADDASRAPRRRGRRRPHGRRAGSRRPLPVVDQWLTERSPLGGARGSTSSTRTTSPWCSTSTASSAGRTARTSSTVVDRLNVPLITVLHTVLTKPTVNQHRVLAALCASSTALVTMTKTARERLIAGWGIHPSRVTVITHGAEDNRADPLDNRPTLGLRPTVLTWGLLGEGKGIEWALLALAELRDITPVPLYRIVGQTHPRVLEHDGEAYRDRLVGMTQRARPHVARPLRRPVPLRPGPAPDRARRRRDPAAVRLPRPGHLRRAHRGRRGWQAGRSRRPSRTPSSCCRAAPDCWCRSGTRWRWPVRCGEC